MKSLFFIVYQANFKFFIYIFLSFCTVVFFDYAHLLATFYADFYNFNLKI